MSISMNTAVAPPAVSGVAELLRASRIPSPRRPANRTSALCPRMPVLDHLRAVLGGIDPSVGAFLGLQHLFGSTASLIDRVAGERISPRDVHLLGKPYSANPEVVSFLVHDRGYWVHPETCLQPLAANNDDEMDRRIAETLVRVRRGLRRTGRRGERVLLIDDGGRAIQMLHTRAFADIRDRFTCVEQTRCGTRHLESLDLQVPVINVAESWVKLEHESPLIAESVNDELSVQLAAMKEAGIDPGRRALVIGYGAIGRAVAVELGRCGYEVTVYDHETGRRAAARRDGFAVHHDLRRALALGGVIIGCTGLPVLDTPDYAHIPDGAVLISASSADTEFRAWQLRPAGTCLGNPQFWSPRFGSRGREHAQSANPRHGHPCFSLYRIANGDRRFYLVNGGFPVNFSGGVDPIPPEKIQLTRSLLYLGALQASRTTVPGLRALDDGRQHLLMRTYNAVSYRRAA